MLFDLINAKKLTCQYCQFCQYDVKTDNTDKTDTTKKYMAHYEPATEFTHFSGALSKTKDTQRYCVTRIKSVKDPITGEVLGMGQKEIYAQERRDYKRHPLTPAEQAQREKWREACRQASAIVRDKNHPQYMELYHRWREQLNTATPCKQFPNFVRAELARDRKPREG